MNESMNAIWWRLTQPHTRALASLLTAPALWHTGCELSPRQLLGEHGFRLLLNWDEHGLPQPENTLLSPLLGHYAENLLALWFRYAPHCQLLAQNLVIISPDTQQTLGELDFIVSVSGIVYHIELCCKYFSSESGLPETLVGLNHEDTFLRKQHKLTQQLALSQHPYAQNVLRQQKISTKIQQASIVRGTLFTASGSLPTLPCFTKNAWCGTLLTNWHNAPSDARWTKLTPPNYLAPARVMFIDTQSTIECATQKKSGIYAHVTPRPDGFWHETMRLMFQAA